MLKKLGAALAVGALALTIHAGVATSAISVAEAQPPAVPQITVTPATCDNKVNTVQVAGFTDAYKANYRFVVFLEDPATALIQIPKAGRALLFTGAPQNVLDVQSKADSAYGKKVTVKAYWFNNQTAQYKYPKAELETVSLQVGETLRNAKYLGTSEPFTLVNPAQLNCAAAPAPDPGNTAEASPADPGQGGTTDPGQGGNVPDPGNTAEASPADPGQGGNEPGQGGNEPGQGGNEPDPGNTAEASPADPGQGGTTDPGQGNQPPVTAPIATAPDAPTFSLTAAQCVEGKATDNVMTVDKTQANDNLRFVATHDGKSISLNAELRTKLWTEGKLTAEDIKTAYPLFVFDYSKPISVQPYFFDKEKAYAQSLYDTTLKLTVGKSDRFIKLGEPKSLTLVDKDTLNCQATAPIATAPDAPTFSLTAAQCVEGKATDNVMTVDKTQANDNLRFVATHDGKSISLNAELRTKLWTEGKLTAEDIKTAYPLFVFDYSKPISVQPYFFDKEKAYAQSLYDTTLKLTVGKSDRFIKLGEPKSLTLVDKDTLNCGTAPTGEPTTPPTGEPTTPPTGEPTTPPTGEPTTPPTGEPTTPPTGEPTTPPTGEPTTPPTGEPTTPPTGEPTTPPTGEPTTPPSLSPSATPSAKASAGAQDGKKGKLAKTGFDAGLAISAFALMAGAGALLTLKKRRES